VTPLVSILIPCFNAARYVASAIESALAQTWPNKEVILVDDGSTDGSSDIIDQFTARGVTVIHQENRGQSAAANRALKDAKGDCIKFFDSDDLLHPELISRQMERLGQGRSAVVSAEWGRFYNDEPTTFRLNQERVWRDMEATEWLVEAWMNARPMMQCALWLIPREVITRSGGWNEGLSLINDFEFFARVLCQADQVRFAGGAPVYYRSGVTGTLSGTRSRHAVESACESLLLGTGHLLSRRNDSRARLACANVLQDFIYTYYPDHADLRAKVVQRIEELGGSDLQPSGPPRFEKLRKVVGWKLAKRIQLAVYRAGYKPRPSPLWRHLRAA
jgi:glycosyltransferase involved in cell wall biosynthesis